jgi:hypothetical protein
MRPHSILKCAAAAAVAAAALLASASAQVIFIEQNGIVVGEAENADTPSNWPKENSTGGFTGTGYIRYAGPQTFNNPPNSQTVSYTIDIATPGTWKFQMRSRKDGPVHDAQNDTWVRMDNGPWVKHFTEGLNSTGQWTFNTLAEPLLRPPFVVQEYNLSAGRHTLQFAGRSTGHKIDRWHLYLSGRPNSLDASLPETTAPVVTPTPTAVPTPTPAPRQEIAYINFRNNQNNFTPIAARNTNASNFAVTGAGLRIGVNEATPTTERIGYWDGVIPGIVLQAGDVWEIEFEITTEATQALLTQLPTMRLRVNDSSFQTGLLLNLESLGTGSNAPVAGQGRRYKLYYTATEAVAGEGLRVSFDYLYTPGLGNRADLGVFLQEVKVTLVK